MLPSRFDGASLKSIKELELSDMCAACGSTVSYYPVFSTTGPPFFVVFNQTRNDLGDFPQNISMITENIGKLQYKLVDVGLELPSANLKHCSSIFKINKDYWYYHEGLNFMATLWLHVAVPRLFS